MAVPRIYYSDTLSSHTSVTLDDWGSRHLLKVLRLKVGDRFELFNGTEHSYQAVIKEVVQKRAVVAVGAVIDIERESPLKIHLMQAISRGERMDYAVQKAVELGVDQVTPLRSDHCAVILKKDRVDHRLQHWQRVAMSASEQCGRTRVPVVNRPCTWQESLTSTTHQMRVVCAAAEPVVSLSEIQTPIDSVVVFIGPEGGWSEQEMSQASEQGCHFLSLGPRVLRTETATVVALTLLQNHFGDLCDRLAV